MKNEFFLRRLRTRTKLLLDKVNSDNNTTEIYTKFCEYF